MESFFANLLQTLPAVAKSPYALGAYAIAVVAYLILGWRVARHRELLSHLTKLPREQRLRALQTEMSEMLPESVTFEQWMRLRKQRYVFWGCLIAGVTAVAVLAATILTMDRGKVTTSISLSDQDQQAFAEAQEQSGVRKLTTAGYEQSIHDGLLTIDSALEYRARLLEGKLLPYLNPAYPIRWSYPSLSIKSVNTSKSPILLTKLQVTIEDSKLDSEPIPMITGAGSSGQFGIVNDGWQKIVDGEATIELYDIDACPDHNFFFNSAASIPEEPNSKPWATFTKKVSEEAGKPISFDVRPFIPAEKQAKLVGCPGYANDVCREDHTCTGVTENRVACYDKRTLSLDLVERDQLCNTYDRRAAALAVQNAWHDKLVGGKSKYHFTESCKAEPICAIGSIKYKSGKQDRNFRFAVGISLNPPGAGAGHPPDWSYSLFLRADAIGKTYERSISQEIKPGETDHFNLQLATNRSATFRLRVALLDNSGSILSTQRISMGIFIPRTHEEDITTRNVRCNLKLDYDGPLDCSSPTRHGRDRDSEKYSKESPKQAS